MMLSSILISVLHLNALTGVKIERCKVGVNLLQPSRIVHKFLDHLLITTLAVTQIWLKSFWQPNLLMQRSSVLGY